MFHAHTYTQKQTNFSVDSLQRQTGICSCSDFLERERVNASGRVNGCWTSFLECDWASGCGSVCFHALRCDSDCENESVSCFCCENDFCSDCLLSCDPRTA